MARPRKLWAIQVGARGARVRAYERAAGGPLWLRWWVPATDSTPAHSRYRALEHTDKELAEKTAKEVAAALLASNEADARGTTPLVDVLARYQTDVADHGKGAAPREAKRRAEVWTAFLGATFDVNLLDAPTLDRFVRERRDGKITLPETSEFSVRAKVTDRAIGADLEYLRAVLRHATLVKKSARKSMLASNPMAGYEIPHNKNPRRPVATYDRFLAIIEHADAIDPQRLFRGFLGLVEALGWRVSAICSLRWADVDLTAMSAWPHGRIFKRAAFDKEGRSMWLPLSVSARAAVDSIRAVSPGVGEFPVFPAPRAREELAADVRAAVAADPDVIALPIAGKGSKTGATAADTDRGAEIPKPWTRHHARKLLERAEDAAGVGHQEGSDFHAYRRAWSTARKHLPDADVMAAGGWSDPRALKQSYQLTDDATLLSVVNEPTKVRDVGAVKQAEGA